MRSRATLRRTLVPDRLSRQAILHVSARFLDRRQLLQGAMAAALPLSLYGCAGDKGAKREPLIVGGLPVTCNLTLPVACTAKTASIKAGTAGNDFEFEYRSTAAGPRSRNRSCRTASRRRTCWRRSSWIWPTRK